MRPADMWPDWKLGVPQSSSLDHVFGDPLLCIGACHALQELTEEQVIGIGIESRRPPGVPAAGAATPISINSVG